MATIHLVRTVSGFKAADDAAIEAMRKLAQGEVVRVELRRPRNPQFHRKFFALLQLVRDATDQWPTVEALLVALKYHMGWVEHFRLADGTEVQVPKSISFGSMDELEFTRFYDGSLRALAEIAGGIPEEHLRVAVMEEINRG